MEKNQTNSNASKLAIFWTRMTGWLLASCVAPVAVFATKFGLFSEEQYAPVYDELGNVVNSTAPALNGWGIVSCLIVGFTLISIIKEVVKAYTGYSLTKQVLTGIVHSILPLVICFAMCYFLDGVLDNIRYCLLVLIITKLVAIPLNPLPKWRYEKNGVENYNDFLSTVASYIKDKKEV